MDLRGTQRATRVANSLDTRYLGISDAFPGSPESSEIGNTYNHDYSLLDCIKTARSIGF